MEEENIMSGANSTLEPLTLIVLFGLPLLFTPDLQLAGYSFLFVVFVFLFGKIFKVGPITSILLSAFLVGIIIAAFGVWLIGIPVAVASFLFLLLLFLYYRESY